MMFIAGRLETNGFVNRKDLMAFFGISMPQASIDLQSFLKLHPGAMQYNPSSKRYESAKATTSALQPSLP